MLMFSQCRCQVRLKRGDVDGGIHQGYSKFEQRGYGAELAFQRDRGDLKDRGYVPQEIRPVRLTKGDRETRPRHGSRLVPPPKFADGLDLIKQGNCSCGKTGDIE